MEYRVLQYFLAVAQEENISRAAEALHLTQPTLSRQIAQLEEELGTQLFIRGKRTVLTDAGMMLRKKAEEVSCLMDAIKIDFQTRKDMAGQIRIGSGIYAGSNALLSHIPKFMEQFPQVAFDIYTASADLLKERMDHGLLDFAIMQEPIDISSYDYLRLPEKDEWGLLMRAAAPFAKKAAITREEVRDIKLITSRRAIVQGELKNWLGNIDFHATVTTNLNGNILPVIEAGDFCMVTLQGAVNKYDPARFAFVPFSPSLSTTIVLAWKKLSPVFGPAAEFLNYVRSILSANAEG